MRSIIPLFFAGLLFVSLPAPGYARHPGEFSPEASPRQWQPRTVPATFCPDGVGTDLLKTYTAAFLYGAVYVSRLLATQPMAYHCKAVEAYLTERPKVLDVFHIRSAPMYIIEFMDGDIQGLAVVPAAELYAGAQSQ